MIRISNMTKIYTSGGYKTLALDNVSLHIEEGEFLSIMGPSGSGKSTLLNILGCMDKPTEGEYIFQDVPVHQLKMSKLHRFRKEKISFVFQYFALMNQYSVFKNVEMPLIAQNIPYKRRKEIVNEKLEMLGILELRKKRPVHISGGQQQRVAIARALVSDHPVILADEPTGALDSKTSEELLEVLHKINQEGKTIVLVTHNENVAKNCKRIVRISDGKIAEDSGLTDKEEEHGR